ncbi:hypothetical protein OG884_34375 [Streptosporangium sp. NBC_01755]|nr:hypothetical protein OG884_34375 [Streptosporangium sp. NBC_01755]
MRQALEDRGAICEVLAPHEGQTGPLSVDRSLGMVSSVLYDAVLLTDGAALSAVGNAVHFVREAFKHGKAIGAVGSGATLLEAAALPGSQGVVSGDDGLIEAIAVHRHHDRDITGFAA